MADAPVRTTGPIPQNHTGSGNPYAQFAAISGLDRQLANLEPASFEERAAAMTIDLLLCVAVAQILTAVGIPKAIGDLFALIYFVFGQFYFGRTFGKHLLGLRVVHESSIAKLTVGQLFLRETVGKTLSTLVFGLGYLAVIFGSDREAWHDRLSKTKVVSFRSHEMSIGKQILRGFGSIAAAGAIFVGGLAGVYYFTSYPLQTLQSRLYAAGIRMQGLHGSLYSGYRVDRISWQNQEDSVELEGIELELRSALDLMSGKKIEIQKIGVGKGYLKFVSVKRDREPSSAVGKKESGPEKVGASAGLLAMNDLVVREMDIREIVLETKEDKFQLKRLYVENFAKEKARLSVSRIYVDSSDFIFNVPEVSLDEEGVKMGKFIEALVKPTMLPEFLKSDSDVRAKMSGSLKDPSFEMTAFSNQIKLNRGLMGASLDVKSWSPGHYLRGHWPLNRLNLRLYGKGDLKSSLIGATVQGDFSVNQVPFRIVEGQTVLSVMMQGLSTVHDRGAYQAKMILYPGKRTEGSWMRLSSNFQLPTQAEEFAFLNYGKAWGTLNEVERDMIAKDLAFFANPLFGPTPLKSLDLREPASR